MSEKQLYANGQEITPNTNYDKDSAKKIIAELQTAVQEFADKIASTLEEAKAYSDTTYIQATGYSDYVIAELINGAPDTLNTLKEIADAMRANETVVEALDAAIGSKASDVEYQAHASNTAMHVTASKQEQWNAYATAIANETSARQSADTTLNTAITNEVTARKSADASLNTAITNETTARKNADALKANLSGGNTLTGRQYCTQTLTLDPLNYAKMAFVSEARYDSNANARAGYGFHNAGWNAVQLYLDTDGYLKYLDTSGNVYTLNRTLSGAVSSSSSLYG